MNTDMHFLYLILVDRLMYYQKGQLSYQIRFHSEDLGVRWLHKTGRWKTSVFSNAAIAGKLEHDPDQKLSFLLVHAFTHLPYIFPSGGSALTGHSCGAGGTPL